MKKKVRNLEVGSPMDVEELCGGWEDVRSDDPLGGGETPRIVLAGIGFLEGKVWELQVSLYHNAGQRTWEATHRLETFSNSWGFLVWCAESAEPDDAEARWGRGDVRTLERAQEVLPSELLQYLGEPSEEWIAARSAAEDAREWEERNPWVEWEWIPADAQQTPSAPAL